MGSAVVRHALAIDSFQLIETAGDAGLAHNVCVRTKNYHHLEPPLLFLLVANKAFLLFVVVVLLLLLLPARSARELAAAPAPDITYPPECSFHSCSLPSGLASLRRMTRSAHRSCALICPAEPCEASTSSIASPPAHTAFCQGLTRFGIRAKITGRMIIQRQRSWQGGCEFTPFTADSAKLESAAKSKPPEPP
jgi:hypothetical protein